MLERRKISFGMSGVDRVPKAAAGAWAAVACRSATLVGDVMVVYLLSFRPLVDANQSWWSHSRTCIMRQIRGVVCGAHPGARQWVCTQPSWDFTS